MKAKKKQKHTQNIAILHDYLALIAQEPNKRVQTFFHLLYVQESPNYILLHSPLQTLKTTQETQAFSVYEACSLLLACNEQNIAIFMMIPSFTMLCQAFCSRFHSLHAKYHIHYIQCIQASILHHIDSKAIRAITKHTRTLREQGIIGFHEQKCIETAMQIDLTKVQNAFNNAASKATSFIHLPVAKTPLKNQIDAIVRAKKILKKVTWANKLLFLCEEDFTKKVVVIGGQKTGKSTLIATLLYDGKKSIEANTPLEAKAPIEYCYGKSLATIEYMHLGDLQSLQESPITNIANSYKQLQQTFHDCLKHGYEKMKYEKLYNSCFPNNKINIADHIIVPQNYEILQFMHLINTPSLIPQTFRHLQVYNYTAKSDIVLYLASYNEMNLVFLYDKIIAVLLRLINKANISHIHFIITHIDRANMTLRKRQNICQKIQTTIEQRLTCQQKEKQQKLEKLTFHFITAGVTHAIRCHGSSTSESGFDIATSGILELESTLFTHVFGKPLKHFNISLLENILTLCHIAPESIQTDSNTTSNQDAVRLQINHIKALSQAILKKLPAQYYSFYDAFTNLRDNLYAQFIQALNYETKKRGNIDMQKLKTSMIQSLIVGLRELAQILHKHFFAIREIHEITTLLQPNNTQSLANFATTKQHKKILELIFMQYKTNIQTDFFGDSNTIVVEHLSYRLDILLPNTIKKTEIQEDSVIVPLKESFDYYFLLLERNINTLFHNKINLFHTQLQQLEYILESCFIEYFNDSKSYAIEEFDTLITMLVHGGQQ